MEYCHETWHIIHISPTTWKWGCVDIHYGIQWPSRKSVLLPFNGLSYQICLFNMAVCPKLNIATTARILRGPVWPSGLRRCPLRITAITSVCMDLSLRFSQCGYVRKLACCFLLISGIFWVFPPPSILAVMYSLYCADNLC